MDNSETQEVFNSIKDKLSHWTSSVFNEFYGLHLTLTKCVPIK